MIGTIAFCGLSAAACGYHEFQRMRSGNVPYDREMHMDHFRGSHSLREATAADIIPRRKTVSFDLFDTLIGRDVPRHDSIFDLVEAFSGVTGFAEARKQAGAGFCNRACLGSIDDVYEHLARNRLITGNLQQLQELEWKMELEHCVLIRSNVDKLLAVPEDTQIIIVSDTFYSATKLRSLLEHLNFPRLDRITIFASRSGKSDSWVWPILSELYDIISHTGDNLRSDVSLPLASRMVRETTHSARAHESTGAENLMFRLAGENPKSPEYEFGCLMRRLSLGNPYTFEDNREKFFWYRVHSSYTVPVFWYFIHSIKNVLELNPNIKHIAAVSRDCILIEDMLKRYILGDRGIFTSKDGAQREVTVARLSSSRRINGDQLERGNTDYLDYVKEALGGDTMQTTTLVIDVNGTYRSLSLLTQKYFNMVPRAHYLSIQNAWILPHLRNALTAAIPGIDTNVMEKMNVKLCGSLVGWEGSRSEPFGGPVRTPCEYSELSIEVTERMFNHDMLKVLKPGFPAVFPRTRVMSALLQKATMTVGPEIPHKNGQRLLDSFVYHAESAQSKRTVELCSFYSRILTVYHDRSAQEPVRLKDLSGKFGARWTEYMRNLVLISKGDHSTRTDITIGTCETEDDARVFQLEHQENTDLLVIHVVSDSSAAAGLAHCTVRWRLHPVEELGEGSLYVFRNIPLPSSSVIQKPSSAVEDLPDVPTHAIMTS